MMIWMVYSFVVSNSVRKQKVSGDKFIMLILEQCVFHYLGNQ